MRPLFLSVLLATAACSSANFDVAATSADDAATPSDTATVSGDDSAGGTSDGGNSVVESGVADACSDLPPTPPCATAMADYNYQIDTPRIAAVGKLYKGREILLHVKLPRAGRLGKVILRMSAVPSGITPGTNGHVTVTAYRRGCKPILLGKSMLPPQTGEDWSFYFDATTTVLPTMPAGTDIDLVVTTDSTAYKFDMIGGGRPSSNPYDLYWGTREGATGDFDIDSSTVLSCMVWTYAC
jgi:hypothetical protein